jgi:predicted metal-dependent phosphoesterase TrpH
MLGGFANLHLHTVFSDGELSPLDVVRAHAAAGFRVIAITDHDTLGGLDALGELSGHGVQILPGVELSIEDDPDHGLVEIHLLGYAFRPGDPRLRSRLEVASQAREQQKIETVRRLAALGYAITWEMVRSQARGNVGKPHIVAAIEKIRPDVSREDLYVLMGPGGAAQVPRPTELSLQDGVDLIRGAGGVAVLAHPGVYDHIAELAVTFETCLRAGVAGLEVTYPQDPKDPYGPGSRALMERFGKTAKQFDWVATGGDDFHGPRITPLIRLAQWRATPASCVDELTARAR